jgi:Kef-type K+ transport system membrane component KefB
MSTILVLLILGILLGRLLRNKPGSLKLIDQITTGSIYLLLFLLGISIGANKAIISNLSNLGLTAVTITAFSLAGSILLSIIVYRLFFRKSNTIITKD